MKSPITFESHDVSASRAREEADDWMVRLDDVEVEYRSSREQIRTLKEYAIRLLQGRVKYDRFRALDRVSFTVRQGEVFGVIGRNGAGKSTLLKVVSRVLKPTGGRVRVRGRVAPLLELGAGFHPELSGRENVYLNGTLLGYKKAELDDLFDRIVDFAELWDFIDAPLRTYSTGMAVRLGFAVATATQPDLLLVDEVLSVGDERFREKCAERMRSYRENGATILLVTHDISLITRMCDRAVCLNHGRIEALGKIDEVIESYRSLNQFDPRGRRAAAGADPDAPAPAAEKDERAELVAEAMQRSWRYPYELPDSTTLPSTLSPELVRLQQTRWRMLQTALETALPGAPAQASCLEIGCGQGYFALQLANAGFEKVVGIDGSDAEIQDARLLRRLYEAANLEFHQADFARLEADSFGQFDLVLLAGVLEQSENPIRTLRAAKSFARRAVIVETAVMPEAGGGESFTLVDRSADDSPLRLRGAPPLALIPSLQTLQAVMRQIGFARVERIFAPPEPDDALSEYEARGRVMLVGFPH